MEKQWYPRAQFKHGHFAPGVALAELPPVVSMEGDRSVVGETKIIKSLEKFPELTVHERNRSHVLLADSACAVVWQGNPWAGYIWVSVVIVEGNAGRAFGKRLIFRERHLVECECECECECGCEG